MALTLIEVKGYMGIPQADVREDFALQAALDAAHDFVKVRCAAARTTPDSSRWPHDLRLAVLRTVQRWHALRASPDGLAGGFEDGQSATRVAASDPDVNRLMAPYLDVVVA